jgi:hypothetical protein
MKIDRKLNLVQKFESGGTSIYVHSTPISRVVWEEYFEVIAKTYSKIFSGGMGATSGPRTASLMLRKIAKSDGEWLGDGGVEIGLMGEIRRLTSVVVAGPGGWQAIPLETAIGRNVIDADSVSEAENAIVFFIVASAVLSGAMNAAKLAICLGVMTSLWGVQTTLSDVTEYAASLAISTVAEPITEKKPELLVAY